MGIIKVILLLVTLFVFALETFFYQKVSEPKFALSFTKIVPTEGTVLERRAYISGAVEHPGVYTLSEGELLVDLIGRAAVLPAADQEYIQRELNLASKVADEAHIFIPFYQDTVSKFGDINSTGLININTATKEQLISLPGIGESIAGKIIANRPYSEVGQLSQVSGIGEKLLTSIKDKVIV